MKKWQQTLILPLVMLVTVLAVVATPLQGPLKIALAYLAAALEQLGVWAPLLYVFLKALGTGLALPAAPLSMLAGAVFGTLPATLWTTLGAGLGAIVAFYLSRFVLRSYLERRFAAQLTWLRPMDEQLAAEGFWYVLSTRLTPFLPFNFLNYLYGLTKVKPKTYILATLLGIVPSNACYAWFGETVGRIALENTVAPAALVPAFIALTGLAGLALMPVLLQRIRENRR
ncbi:TVP38/TMEM64 family protein [Anthocerotibacter panamensis]|uniref:TVP38/TMEM64 family protein n=1 Tax=Anthocerotibacter panamensis TaxID=2857077 RepID=UPI001C401782|nr:TVP38/TMEM64 family protein [Anthocerotibacter panamensis]